MSKGTDKAFGAYGEELDAVVTQQRKILEDLRIKAAQRSKRDFSLNVPTTGMLSDQEADLEGIARWEKPVCLIENRASTMMINEEAVELLSRVPGPIIVVAIVGLYRTGKSFLLNLLAGRTDGFPLGSTTNACTKGIWVWLLNHPSKKECSLLLMDTEGLGDVRKGDVANDSHLYVLAVLLSSILVHNSIGVIDNDALEKLQFVTKMADKINTETGRTNHGLDLRKYFPTFVWAVRDFTLDLVDEKGNHITSTHYLENALKEQEGLTQQIKDFNFIRECIRGFFPQRECFTFPYPVADANDMGKLKRMTLHQVTPNFKEQARMFRQYVYDAGTTKTYQDEPVTGRTFCELARTYLKTIKDNGVPCIQSSVETSSRIVNTHAIEESVRVYRTCMNKYQQPVEFVEHLSDAHAESVNEAVLSFIQSAFYDKNNEYLGQLKKHLDEEYHELLSEHEAESLRRCQACLEEISQKLRNNVTCGHYIQPGGYKLYQEDLETLEIEYNKTEELGCKKRACWIQFEKEHQMTADSIRAVDSRLTEEDKRIQEQARELKELKQELKRTKEDMAEKSRQFDDGLQNFAEEVFRLHSKSTRQSQIFTEEHESLLRKHDETLHDGFKNKADDLMRTIDEQKKSRNQKKKEPFYKECEQKLKAMRKDHKDKMEKACEEQKGFLTKIHDTEVSRMKDVKDAFEKMPGVAYPDNRAKIEKKLQEAEQNHTHQFETLKKETQKRIEDFGKKVDKIKKELKDNFKERGKDNRSFWQKLFRMD